jgi:carbon-monoxide dehydrogenase small subunit
MEANVTTRTKAGSGLLRVTILLNGQEKTAEVKPNLTLLELLRDELGYTGTKVGCETGDCGACTVLIDGEPVNSCLVLAVETDGRAITTIEGLEHEGKLDDVQEAFIRHNAVQCGYCTPGMILAGRALLDRNPSPTEEDVREAVSGNLCRCTGYVNIVKAIMAAADKNGVEAAGN